MLARCGIARLAAARAVVSERAPTNNHPELWSYPAERAMEIHDSFLNDGEFRHRYMAVHWELVRAWQAHGIRMQNGPSYFHWFQNAIVLAPCHPEQTISIGGCFTNKRMNH
ncbi:hypothetical protein F1559_002912 [Cyanidiococcus yangmingshanensis]|uniref:Uncharacterized protein n=1 Tax=Cyanidiococcus yangmingshanensis TaxID=2690220 RepID=A0A7J7IHA4_9RHOD|nr:hypothetical protein F1559_002912 [Cyanidiococcus yangmingshanensis]